MAVLTESDFAEMRKMFRADPDSKEQYINSGITKHDLQDGIQGLEDWFESSRATQKAAVDTGAGATLANPLAKKIGKIYYQWKWQGE